jgi:hypothetical protein
VIADIAVIADIGFAANGDCQPSVLKSAKSSEEEQRLVRWNPIPAMTAIPRDHGDSELLQNSDEGLRLNFIEMHPNQTVGDGAGFYRFPVQVGPE